MEDQDQSQDQDQDLLLSEHSFGIGGVEMGRARVTPLSGNVSGRLAVDTSFSPIVSPPFTPSANNTARRSARQSQLSLSTFCKRESSASLLKNINMPFDQIGLDEADSDPEEDSKLEALE